MTRRAWRLSVVSVIAGALAFIVLLGATAAWAALASAPLVMVAVTIAALRAQEERAELRAALVTRDEALKAWQSIDDESERLLDELESALRDLRGAATVLGFAAPVGTLEAEVDAVESFLHSHDATLQRTMALAVLQPPLEEWTRYAQPSEVPSA